MTVFMFKIEQVMSEVETKKNGDTLVTYLNISVQM